MQWVRGMRRNVPPGALHGAASVLMLMLFISFAAAADSDSSNVDLCNGKNNPPLELQIEGCTALLKSAENPTALAIIYNNRGNAYISKGQYDLAIKDYDEEMCIRDSR